MALFIDTHTIDGPISIDDVAKAHAADVQTQDAYGVHYLRYWVDQDHGKIFCLVDPVPQVANAVGVLGLHVGGVCLRHVADRDRAVNRVRVHEQRHGGSS